MADTRSERAQAAEQHHQTGRAARVLQECAYQTRESWSRARRVIAKAEYLEQGSNPRLLVTSLGAVAEPPQLHMKSSTARRA
jgi:hypothetical protein